jgi:hypothetical protein
MKDKKFNSTEQYLIRNKKAINAFAKLPTDILAKIATGEIEPVSIAAIALNNRMPLRVTKKGGTKIKINSILQ